jgi:hypothetical protein
MTYFLEYTIPAARNGENYVFPVSEKHRGYTIPLSETDAEIVHSSQLPARSSIPSSTLEEAKVEAEEVLRHSKAVSGDLYEDPNGSNEAGSGTLILTYTESAGWQEA